MKIDWKTKLSSRKFWAMLGGQATAILTAFNASESIVLQVGAVIGSLGIFAVYMLSEAYVDGKRVGVPTVAPDAPITEPLVGSAIGFSVSPYTEDEDE